MSTVKSYEMLNVETGEVSSRFRYLEGRPKQYRFNAKEGKFNVNPPQRINGSEIVGSTLTFQPLAWRIFTDNILNMGSKTWAELFFVDEKNCLSAILFHSASVENLYKLIEPLYYDELTLADVLISVSVEKKENTKITPKGVYYIAQFTYQEADQQVTDMLKEYAGQVSIYRSETITGSAELGVTHQYRVPQWVLEKRALESATVEDIG